MDLHHGLSKIENKAKAKFATKTFTDFYRDLSMWKQHQQENEARPVFARSGSRTYEVIFMVLIVLNTLFMGMQVELATYAPDTGNVLDVSGVGVAFAVIFSLELVHRFLEQKKLFFLGYDWRWNVFDCFVVATMVVDVIRRTHEHSERLILLVRLSIITSTSSINIIIIMSVINCSIDTPNFRRASNFSLIYVLRLTRILRILQLVKVLRASHDFLVLIDTFRRAMTGLIWFIILLFLALYIAAIAMTEGTIGLCFDMATGPAVCRHFGSLRRSMIAFHAAMWGGNDWPTLFDALLEIHWVYSLIFLASVSFLIIIVVNVMIAACVGMEHDTRRMHEALGYDHTIKARVEAERGVVRRLEEIFRTYDSNGSGDICHEEFVELIDLPEARALMSHLEIDVSDADELFALLDTNREISGQVSLRTWLWICVSDTEIKPCGRLRELSPSLVGHQREQRPGVHRLCARVPEAPARREAHDGQSMTAQSFSQYLRLFSLRFEQASNPMCKQSYVQAHYKHLQSYALALLSV